MEYDLCQPGCGGPGSGSWRTGGATLGFPFVVTWCQPLTGTTYTPDGPYVYINNVKTYTGLTSSWSATSVCCSGTSQVLSYGYTLMQSQGVSPAPPYFSGETVFYNNGLVTYDANSLTGFSLNLIDLWGNNTNECSAIPEISGLTTNGGEIYFSQFGNTIGFSGTSSSFTENVTGFSGSNLTIVQSASTVFSASSSIDVWFTIYPSVTPTPTPTTTPTPTNTPTPSITTSVTPTGTMTPTPTQTPIVSYEFTGFTTDPLTMSGACSGAVVPPIYSNCSFLTGGGSCYLYSDPLLQTPLVAGYYVNSSQTEGYQVTGGLGQITTGVPTPCV